MSQSKLMASTINIWIKQWEVDLTMRNGLNPSCVASLMDTLIKTCRPQNVASHQDLQVLTRSKIFVN